MEEIQETEQELVLTLYDLISEVAALQCFLHGREDAEIFCIMPYELTKHYLRMPTDYIAQDSGELLSLSRQFVRAIDEKGELIK